MKKDNILDHTRKFIVDLFNEKLPGWAVYHNYDHTVETVQAVKEFANHYGLSKREAEILEVAGWFHDSGYISGADGHEEKSADIAMDFLTRHNYAQEDVGLVLKCIRATKVGVIPEDLSESIIKDADLISLGKPDYFEKNELLRQEVELREKKVISEQVWLKRSAEFITSYQFFTEYARARFGQQLQKNIDEIVGRLNRFKDSAS